MAVKSFRLAAPMFIGGSLKPAGAVVSFETDPEKGGMTPGSKMIEVDEGAEDAPEPAPKRAKVEAPAKGTALAEAAPEPVKPGDATPEPRQSRG